MKAVEHPQKYHRKPNFQRQILKPKVLPGMGCRKKMFCHLFISEQDTVAFSGKASPGAETIGEWNRND